MNGLEVTDLSVILHFYNNGLLNKYFSLLSDEELDIVGVKLLSSQEHAAENILELVRNEKAYRYYSNILEGLKEGKTK